MQPQRKLSLLHRQVLIQLQPPQLIENPLDSPRRCADRLNSPRQGSSEARQAEYGHTSPEDVCLTMADMAWSMNLPYAA